MKCGLLFVTLVTFCCFTSTNSARILGYFPTGSKSHLIVHMSVMKALIDKGHDVTIVTTLPWTETDSRYRHITPQNFSFPPVSNIIRNVEQGNNPIKRINFWNNFRSTGRKMSNDSLNTPEMRKLMAEETFDLVILGYFFNEFQLGLGAHFKCPVIFIWMMRSFTSINNLIGNPVESLTVPDLFADFIQPLGFFERLANVVFTSLEMFYDITRRGEILEYYNTNFPSDKYPSYEEMRNKLSLIFANYHFSEGMIRANVPAMVEIGGVQIKPKPDPLPKDIQNFLDSASKNGAIYFCLGSLADTADMPKEFIAATFKVLSTLKQKVLWKWNGDTTPGNAPNILYKKWLPQDDVLAHPNVKLFITHGGHGGVSESIYNAVPMVAIPLFGDQFSNARDVESKGLGLGLNKNDVTEEIFRETILEVLENPKYRNNAKRRADLFKDRPMSPREAVVFWSEYVIRHKGALHMQSPSVHMNFLQLYGLDIFGFLLVIFYICYKSAVFVIKGTISLFCRNCNKNSRNTKEQKKKRQ